MGSVMVKPGLTNLQPYTTAAFQKRDGSGLMFVGGCLEVKGAGSETVQTAYEYCQRQAGGLTRYDIDQVADPTPIQMSARGDAVMQQMLYNIWKRSIDTGCLVNLLVLQRDCVDASRVKDPNFFVRGYWMKGLRATGRWTFGNDTLVGMNPKSPQMTEDQGSFIVGSIEPFMQQDYSTVNGALAVAPLQITSPDVGNCPSGDCGSDQDGGNVVFAINTLVAATNLYASYDGGLTFAEISASLSQAALIADPAYFLTSSNGKVLVASRDASAFTVAIAVLTLNSTLTGFSTSLATVVGSGTMKNTLGPAGNKPVTAPDGTLVWAGEGEVYKSVNNGATWTRIASAISVYTTAAYTLDFMRIVTRGDRMFGAARNKTTDTQTIYVHSDDSGVTWTLDSYVVQAVPTAIELVVADNRVFVVNGGDVFEWGRTGVGTTDLTPAGITSIKNMISIANNGNDMLIIANDNAIWRTVDGLNTAKLESTGITFPAGLSSYTKVKGAHSDSVLIAGGIILARAKEKGFLF